jgi:TRAP-type C4-dicarboxylate transport system substrate-binding protein
MKRISGSTFLATFILLAITWNLSYAAQTINLKLGHAVAPEHPYHLGAMKFAELVAQKTGNKVKIDVYPSTQLGNERDMVEGLQLGTIDLVVTSTGPLGGFVPKMFVVDLPFLFVIGNMPIKSWMVRSAGSFYRPLPPRESRAWPSGRTGFVRSPTMSVPLRNPKT